MKIRLKLTGQDMQVLAQCVLMAGRRMQISGLDSLLAATTLEDLFIRMHRQYVPGKGKFTLRLSLTETAVLTKFVLPQMMDEVGTLPFYVANPILEAINRRIDNEVNIYNSMKSNDYVHNDEQ